MNLAAVVRCSLASARQAGIDFDEAWESALAELPLELPRKNAKARRREIDAWRAALAWSRPFFERAYVGGAAQGAEAAAGSIQELAA